MQTSLDKDTNSVVFDFTHDWMTDYFLARIHRAVAVVVPEAGNAALVQYPGPPLELLGANHALHKTVRLLSHKESAGPGVALDFRLVGDMWYPYCVSAVWKKWQRVCFSEHFVNHGNPWSNIDDVARAAIRVYMQATWRGKLLFGVTPGPFLKYKGTPYYVQLRKTQRDAARDAQDVILHGTVDVTD